MTDALPSWNNGAARRAIGDFVSRVRKRSTRLDECGDRRGKFEADWNRVFAKT